MLVPSLGKYLQHKRKRRKSDTTGVENSLLAVGVASEVIIWNLTKGEREAALVWHARLSLYTQFSH